MSDLVSFTKVNIDGNVICNHRNKLIYKNLANEIAVKRTVTSVYSTDLKTHNLPKPRSRYMNSNSCQKAYPTATNNNQARVGSSKHDILKYKNSHRYTVSDPTPLYIRTDPSTNHIFANPDISN